MVRREWELRIAAPDGRVMGANHDHRAHWRAVHAHRTAARSAALMHARALRIPRMERVRVDVTIYMKAWKRADPGNYPGGSTLKGMIDGLVDAGVMPDDKQAHLDLRMPRLAAMRPGLLVSCVELVIRDATGQGEGAA